MRKKMLFDRYINKPKQFVQAFAEEFSISVELAHKVINSANKKMSLKDKKSIIALYNNSVEKLKESLE
jgi:hypothetical protein